MTSPRPVIKDRTYMLTRRCSERRFFLRPSPEVNEAYVYCFAVAAQHYHLDVYWLSTLSNHEHPGIYDRLGNYPEFTRYFHSLLARCLNAHLSRWESLWSSEQSGVLYLPDADTIFDKMIYALTNPVKDYLVDRVFNWPGVNSLACQLNGKPIVARRPKWFFRGKGTMPEQVELHFVKPPQFAHLSHDEWAAKLRAAVVEVERKAAEERERTGRRVLGRKEVLRQSPFSCPKSCPPRNRLRPQVATRNKEIRIALLHELKRFRCLYRAALRLLREGVEDVLFPRGTYLLHKNWQVKCEDTVTLE